MRDQYKMVIVVVIVVAVASTTLTHLYTTEREKFDTAETERIESTPVIDKSAFNFKVVCLDGVQYWVSRWSDAQGYMAPKYRVHSTGHIVPDQCKENKDE